MLRLKYTGPVDPNRKGGMPLAIGDLYDAETGDNLVRNQNVYDGNIQAQDGATRPKPGVYFAIIYCGRTAVPGRRRSRNRPQNNTGADRRPPPRSAWRSWMSSSNPSPPAAVPQAQ